ncbi:hypothetical protein FACS189440_06100 [Bacteroidia bacterium]|nr:hypothetical protein FACS189440_06100 [Bacteroidia bacterium]
MNKRMFFLMLTLMLLGAVSVNGQEISDDPIMVVTGSVVNTGTLISKGPIDLRTNPAKDSQINNTATGDIQTPALTVGEFTLLNNEGNLCVGCEWWPAALLLKDAARDYEDGVAGDIAKDWTDIVDGGSRIGKSYWPAPTSGVAPGTGRNLMVSQYVYAGTDAGETKVLSITAGADEWTAAADLSPLMDGINWYDAVRLCARSEEGGYTDWYLPWYVELKTLQVNNLLGYYEYEQGNINVNYASSTEYASGSYLELKIYTASSGDSYISKPYKGHPGPPFSPTLIRCVRRY